MFLIPEQGIWRDNYKTFHPTVSSSLKVFEMYQGYAQNQGWAFDILEHMTSDIGQ